MDIPVLRGTPFPGLGLIDENEFVSVCSQVYVAGVSHNANLSPRVGHLVGRVILPGVELRLTVARWHEHEVRVRIVPSESPASDFTVHRGEDQHTNDVVHSSLLVTPGAGG